MLPTCCFNIQAASNHIQFLLNAKKSHNIEIVNNPDSSYFDCEAQRVGLPAVDDFRTYLINLHEIGHYLLRQPLNFEDTIVKNGFVFTN